MTPSPSLLIAGALVISLVAAMGAGRYICGIYITACLGPVYVQAQICIDGHKVRPDILLVPESIGTDGDRWRHKNGQTLCGRDGLLWLIVCNDVLLLVFFLWVIVLLHPPHEVCNHTFVLVCTWTMRMKIKMHRARYKRKLINVLLFQFLLRTLAPSVLGCVGGRNSLCCAMCF